MPSTVAPTPITRAVIEKWALAYLERYASPAGHLRQVLRRRIRRRAAIDHAGDVAAADEAVRAADPLIDALVLRYRATGLIDDAAYAAGQAHRRLARGHSLRRIAAALAAKGVDAADAALALAALGDTAGDPDLAAACAFARRRRLGPYRDAPADAAARRRELAAFARAGFARHHAEMVLAAPDAAAVAALLREAER